MWEKQPATMEHAPVDQGRTVLVTGGGGFLGSRVVAELRWAGRLVTVLDDGSGGTHRTLQGFESDPGIRVCRVDVRDRDAVAEAVGAEAPQTVIHLAGRHFIPYCEANQDETWAVNVDGTRNLLDALVATPPECFVFASTADVYQEARAPHVEDDLLGSPTVYGQSKFAAEELLVKTVPSWGTRLVTTRLFNLYGPRHTVEHLIPAIISQALEGDTLRLGDLTTLRDFVYVGDAADAILGLVACGATGVFNVGTGSAISGLDLVELVGKLVERNLTITLDPARLRASGRQALVADPGKIHSTLPGWRLTPLDEGLRAIIADGARRGD